MVADGNPAVQMMLPMAEMMGWLRKGVGELIRQAGLQLMDLLMQEEVRELAGERSQPQADRSAHRWGSERGYCVVMGQKVPIQRPRVRTTDDKEVRFKSPKRPLEQRRSSGGFEQNANFGEQLRFVISTASGLSFAF